MQRAPGRPELWLPRTPGWSLSKLLQESLWDGDFGRDLGTCVLSILEDLESGRPLFGRIDNERDLLRYLKDIVESWGRVVTLLKDTPRWQCPSRTSTSLSSGIPRFPERPEPTLKGQGYSVRELGHSANDGCPVPWLSLSLVFLGSATSPPHTAAIAPMLGQILELS